MKKTLFCYVLTIVFSTASTYGQETNYNIEIIKTLEKLQSYSIEYDRLNISTQFQDKYQHQRDSVERLYLAYVKEIKYGKQKKDILTFLNNAIDRDSLRYAKQGVYNYTFIEPSSNPNLKEFPTRLEYYKVVRYSLFELDRDRLVPPQEVPFLKHKDPYRPILRHVK